MMKENLKKEPTVELLPLTHTALGVYTYPNKVASYVAVFEFNPVTKEVKFVKEVACGDGKDVAFERFKIMAAQHVLVTE
jgi:hypothetical protein